MQHPLYQSFEKTIRSYSSIPNFKSISFEMNELCVLSKRPHVELGSVVLFDDRMQIFISFRKVQNQVSNTSSAIIFLKLCMIAFDSGECFNVHWSDKEDNDCILHPSCSLLIIKHKKRLTVSRFCFRRIYITSTIASFGIKPKVCVEKSGTEFEKNLNLLQAVKLLCSSLSNKSR